ncbi:hypothetical protein D3C87_1343490 [compost metagenome]
MAVVVGVAASIHDRSYGFDVAFYIQISGNCEIAGCFDVWAVQSHQWGLDGHRHATLDVQILIANALGSTDTHQRHDMLGPVVGDSRPVTKANIVRFFVRDRGRFCG